MLPTDAQERKRIPVYSGFVCYFPDAIVEVAKLSQEGNDQHNPGQRLFWNRAKSGDEMDALCRHMLDGARELQHIDERILHQRAVAWRAMANLQKLCEERENQNPKIQKFSQPVSEASVHDLMSALRLMDDDDPGVQEILNELNTRPGCIEGYIEERRRESRS
jgi:hypothetical protein